MQGAEPQQHKKAQEEESIAFSEGLTAASCSRIPNAERRRNKRYRSARRVVSSVGLALRTVGSVDGSQTEGHQHIYT